jgi:hypothetical protein
VTCSGLISARVAHTSFSASKRLSKVRPKAVVIALVPHLLTYSVEAQKGGSGVVIYFRKEGRALGEVTKVNDTWGFHRSSTTYIVIPLSQSCISYHQLPIPTQVATPLPTCTPDHIRSPPMFHCPFEDAVLIPPYSILSTTPGNVDWTAHRSISSGRRILRV